MTNMRAKMQLRTVTRHQQSEVLEFSAVAAHKYPADGADEDNTYARFSPSADIKISVANPALFGAFNPGETYYVDFTPVQPRAIAAGAGTSAPTSGDAYPAVARDSA